MDVISRVYRTNPIFYVNVGLCSIMLREMKGLCLECWNFKEVNRLNKPVFILSRTLANVKPPLRHKPEKSLTLLCVV